jgi:hypothetical protein
VRIAERLHITPEQVDAISYEDVCDLLDVWRADQVLEEIRAKELNHRG